MSHDPQSHDWARNNGRAILGISAERRRNTENGGDRRSRPAVRAQGEDTPNDGAADRDANSNTPLSRPDD